MSIAHKPRRAVSVLGIAIAIAVTAFVPAAAQEKPNILVIWGDAFAEEDLAVGAQQRVVAPREVSEDEFGNVLELANRQHRP